jgi:NAD(P)-dependent dehydrogenase (short-subunit alcohol dehydrogenase family)
MGRLEGKVCIVTGGARGLGRGTARLFAREGAVVVLGDRLANEGQEVVSNLGALGGSGRFVRTDVTQKTEVEALVASAHDEFGRVDVLVNAAIALGPHVKLEEKTDEMFEAVLKSGFFGTLWAMQAVFPIMRDQGGGRIINFYSPTAYNGQWYTADYNTTKSAIGGLTNSAAAEWAKHNILCNAIAPQAVSGSVRATLPNLDERTPACPMGRLGDPESDIAPVALFLATEESKYVTGEIIRVDGGADLNSAPLFPQATGEELAAWTAAGAPRSHD